MTVDRVTSDMPVKVLELSEGLAAGFAGWMLQSLGATVSRVDTPIDGGSADGIARLTLQAGKTTVALADIADAVAWADIVITDAPDRLAAALGDLTQLGDNYPGRIFAITTPLGLTGPLAAGSATALDAQALSAVSWALGEPGREPLSVPPGILEHQSGLFLASASLVALRHRAATGEGNVIDIALADVLASYVAGNCRFFIHHGMAWQRSGSRATSSGGAYPFVVLPCADGAVCVCGRTRDEWNRLVKVMGDPAWASEPRYQSLRAMGREYPDEVDALIKPWFAAHTMAELEQLAMDNSLIVAPVRSLGDVLQTPQFLDSDFLRDSDEHGTKLRLPTLPFRTTVQRAENAPDISASLLSRPLPGGVHDHDISNQLPLAGLRVVDFGWVWSAPWVGTMLGELGAQVIKIEHGKRLDNLRLSGKIWRDGAVVEGRSTEMSPMYHQINHGKLGVTLNVKDPRAVELLVKLVASSDLVVENMSPGSMERSGLGYETLRAANPKLVMLAMSAAGQFGALSGMRAYAPTMSSFAGLEALIGYPGDRPLGSLNFAIGDPNASSHGLLAALAALHRAAATGEGSYIDLSQVAALTGTLRTGLVAQQEHGKQPPLTGNRHPAMAPHGIFPAAGSDRWLTLAVTTDAEWAILCSLAPAADWACDPRFATVGGRLAGVGALETGLAQWTRAFDRDALVAMLRAKGLASVPVLSIEEMWRHPHFAARGSHAPVEIPVYGQEQIYAAPWRFTRFAPQVSAPGPALGQHNREILMGLLGLSAAEFDTLTEAGVIA